MMMDLTKKPQSSFLSCEKDLETILRKLFIENPVWARDLKKLLVINNNDCLDEENHELYDNIVNNMSLKDLIDNGYIYFSPTVKNDEHQEFRSYILISFTDFSQTYNPEFRDCSIEIDVVCPSEKWDIGNYRLRPFKILGYLDGILNKARLSGIGTLEFAWARELILDHDYSGYTIAYRAVHGTDDIIPIEEE